MIRCMDAETHFRTLFDETYPSLRRYALHRGLDAADADDLVAEVLAIVWRRLDDVPANDPLPWVFAVAGNVRRNHLRASRRRARLHARLPIAPPTHLIEPDDPGSIRLRDALRSLSETDRDVLLLVAWDGLTSQQLATALDCSAGTARVRLHRARTRLADALGAPHPAEPHDEPATTHPLAHRGGTS